MKGYFQLRYDPYTEELSFGNLGESGSLGTCRDAIRAVNGISTLIAHDVVEHDIGHRTRTYVTYENEFRALGAINAIRGGQFDMYIEMSGQIDYVHRDIKPVPYIVGKHLLSDGYISADFIKYLIKKEHLLVTLVMPYTI